jgi:hypothetical protein
MTSRPVTLTMTPPPPLPPLRLRVPERLSAPRRRPWALWRHWLVTLSLICVIGVSAALVDRALRGDEEEAARAAATARRVERAARPSEVSYLIPRPLPFPEPAPIQGQRAYTFSIPDAEFELRVKAPVGWAARPLSGEVVRFEPARSSAQERSTRLTFSAGCFGSCDTIEDNIANALKVYLNDLTRQGRAPRLTHWHVHHRAWVEFSVLTSEGDTARLTGVSVRWSPEWLNALRCEMSAPIDFPAESEEVLHLAWDLWAPLFVTRCRDYEVISWE